MALLRTLLMIELTERRKINLYQQETNILIVDSLQLEHKNTRYNNILNSIYYYHFASICLSLSLLQYESYYNLYFTVSSLVKRQCVWHIQTLKSVLPLLRYHIIYYWFYVLLMLLQMVLLMKRENVFSRTRPSRTLL